MQKREIKSVGAIVTSSDDGIIEAIVSVFGNLDSYNERVMYGAFTKSLAQGLPTGVLSHDWNNPVSTTLSAEELAPNDPRLPEAIRSNGGLLIRGEFYEDIPSSWEAFLKVKRRLFREFSIGYEVVKDGFVDGVRELYEVKLHEWSPVLVGANPATSLLAVKSGDYTNRIELLESELMEAVQATKARADMRIKAGRVLSARNAEALTELANSLGTARKEIIRILNEAAPKPKSDEGKAFDKGTAQKIILRNYLQGLDL